MRTYCPQSTEELFIVNKIFKHFETILRNNLIQYIFVQFTQSINMIYVKRCT